MVVIVFTVGAAVKPAANSLPENTKEPEPTPPTTEAVQQEPYPFNLMSLDWSGEELEGWTRYDNYGVTGAYQHVWNKGLTDTEYSREVQQAKERIERRMRGEW